MKKILLSSLLLSSMLWAGAFEDAEKAYQKGNYSEAFSKYESAAASGNAAAQYKLAEMYYEGQGVESNKTEAVNWYKKSAELGYIEAEFQMAYLYENGLTVEKDSAEAARWYKKVIQGLVKKYK